MLKVLFPTPPPPAAPRQRQAGDVITVTYGIGTASERSYTGICQYDPNNIFVVATKGDQLVYQPFMTRMLGVEYSIVFHDHATLDLGAL